jgi:hypothetical protein
MAVYQCHDFERDKSTWILIKPLQGSQSRLRNCILANYTKHPMALHVLFFSMATENWRWYFDFLRKKMVSFVSAQYHLLLTYS